jgi:hypothetical protein
MGLLDNAKKRLQQFGEETISETDKDLPEPDKKNSHSGIMGGLKSKIPNLGKSFHIDPDDTADEVISKHEEEYHKMMPSSGEPVPSVQEGRIQDVLELLDIPPTFEVSNVVLLPEDFDGIDFQIQIPEGYEPSEVEAFKDRARKSTKELVDLLKLRNKHVAQLASTIDRLQVDANNLKFDAEVANGINIMPTDSIADLENELMELRLLTRQLQDENNRLSKGGSAEGYEQVVDSQMSDQVSLLTRENDELREEIYALKNQLAVYMDDDNSIPSQPSHRVVSTPMGSISRPDDSGYASGQLASGSVFYSDEDESLDEFLESNKSFYESQNMSDDDDDDELDRIFNGG